MRHEWRNEGALGNGEWRTLVQDHQAWNGYALRDFEAAFDLQHARQSDGRSDVQDCYASIVRVRWKEAGPTVEHKERETVPDSDPPEEVAFWILGAAGSDGPHEDGEQRAEHAGRGQESKTRVREDIEPLKEDCAATVWD